MKLSVIFVFASLAVANALAPNSSPTNRRAFFAKAASTVAVVSSLAIAAPTAAFAKDDYSLDFDESIVVKKADTSKEGGGSNGGLIVGGALAGGLALSLPFFAPNLARMAGIKNAKTPPK
jgi:hypothetical protein